MLFFVGFVKLTRSQCLWALGSSVAAAAGRNLVQEWQRIATETDGTVGAAVLHLGSGQMISLHGSERFPLASVCKLPIAMNMLALVDEGKLALNQEIEVLPRDVFSGVKHHRSCVGSGRIVGVNKCLSS